MEPIVRAAAAALVLLCCQAHAAAQQASPFDDGITARVDLAQVRSAYTLWRLGEPEHQEEVSGTLLQLAETIPALVRRADHVLVYQDPDHKVPVVRVNLPPGDIAGHEEPALGKFHVERRSGTILLSADPSVLSSVGDALDSRALPAADVMMMAGAIVAAVFHVGDRRPFLWTARLGGCLLIQDLPTLADAAALVDRFGEQMVAESAQYGVVTRLDLEGRRVVVRMTGDAFACMSMNVAMTIPLFLRYQKERSDRPKSVTGHIGRRCPSTLR